MQPLIGLILIQKQIEICQIISNRMQGTYRVHSARNNRHFEQNFEDSENQSVNYNQADNSGPGRAVQLIRIRPYGKIEVDQEALDIISQCDLPVGFCCIAGKYRTGKSFLMNKLLKLQGSGFRVDPSTVACTEGIWMWSKPIMNEKESNYIFLIDTQGSASTNRDATNDAKVFTLANLISSYLIYNSVGAIDQKSISELNLVTQLSRNIALQDRPDYKNNEENLYKQLPSFLWLIRDFTLEPTDRNGRRLTPNEYLEDVLFEQNTAVKSDENTKKIRRALTKYYHNRDCMTLVRPASEEKDLQKLNQLPEHALRRDFIQGVNALRMKIQNNTGPKKYLGNPLYGGAIASMIESYVNMMNNGGIPSIQTAWEQINADEGIFAYDQALAKFNDLYRQNFQEDEPKGEQIHTLLRVMNQASMDEFHNNIAQPNPQYEEKLRDFLGQKQQAIIRVNKDLTYYKNIEILKECMGPVLQKIESGQYESNPNQANVDILEASQRYQKRAKGQTKGDILTEFIATINPIVLGIGANSSQAGNQSSQQQLEIVRREKEAQVETLRKQIASLQNQIESSKVTQQMKVATKTGKDGRTSVVAKKQITKKPVKGCCGGDTKCSIM